MKYIIYHGITYFSLAQLQDYLLNTHISILGNIPK